MQIIVQLYYIITSFKSLLWNDDVILLRIKPSNMQNKLYSFYITLTWIDTGHNVEHSPKW